MRVVGWEEWNKLCSRIKLCSALLRCFALFVCYACVWYLQPGRGARVFIRVGSDPAGCRRDGFAHLPARDLMPFPLTLPHSVDWFPSPCSAVTVPVIRMVSDVELSSHTMPFFPCHADDTMTLALPLKGRDAVCIANHYLRVMTWNCW